MDAMVEVTPVPLLPLPPVMVPKRSARVEKMEMMSGKLLVWDDHHVQVPGVLAGGVAGTGSAGVTVGSGV
jgi:hypothetical protein